MRMLHQDYPRRDVPLAATSSTVDATPVRAPGGAERPAGRTSQRGGTIEAEVNYSGQPEVSYIPTPYREETMSIRVSLEH